MLRDAILHALADDCPTSSPRDVVVLCADLPRFAPHLEAVLGDPQGAPSLPYVLTDRIARPSGAARRRRRRRALRLLGGRYARSAVLDLLRDPFVQAPLRLAEEDVERYGEWTDDGVVRWGLDGAHREVDEPPRQLRGGHLAPGARPAARRHRAPARRRSPGARACAPSTRATTSSASARSARSSPRSATLEDDRATPRTIPEWCEFVRDLAASLFDTGVRSRPGSSSGSTGSSRRSSATRPGSTACCRSPSSGTCSTDRASSERTRASNGPGGVTVTSLVPLRNVPFAVVAVLGMDEASLQRTASVDVAFGPARVGDRDPRADVRAALLGAILAARDRLIVTHEAPDVVSEPGGADVDGARRAPRGASTRVCEGGATGLAPRHPRHAHGDDDLVYDPGARRPVLLRPRRARAGARAARARLEGEDALRRGLPAATAAAPSELELGALGTFLSAPQRTYLRARSRAGCRNPAELPDDDLPTSLDDLERWGRDRDAHRRGRPSTSRPHGRRRSGTLRPRPGRRHPTRPSPASPGGSRATRSRTRARAGTRAAEPSKRLRAKEKDREPTTRVRSSPTARRRRRASTSTAASTASSAGPRRATTGASGSRPPRPARAHRAHPEVQWRATARLAQGQRADTRTGRSTAPRRRSARGSVPLASLERARRRCDASGSSEPLPAVRARHGEDARRSSRTARVAGARSSSSGLEGWTIFNGCGDGDEAAVKYCFPISYEAASALRCQPGRPLAPPRRGRLADARVLARRVRGAVTCARRRSVTRTSERPHRPAARRAGCSAWRRARAPARPTC